jgi:hypothetical protein
MKGFVFVIFPFTAKGYLARRDEDPDAVVVLGDSAYNRLKNKETMGFGLPVPQKKDGSQQKVLISFVGVGNTNSVSS